MDGRLEKSLFLLSLVLGAACSEPPSTPNADGHNPRFQGQNTPQSSLFGIEREFAELADSAPEFAGYYYDAKGALVVRLVNAAPPTLERVISQIQRRGRRVHPNVGQPALYQFSELVEWRQAIRPVLPIGVYSLDLDEVSNKLQVGVAEMSVGAKIRAIAASLGIPTNAIEIVKSPAPALRSSLHDRIRPVRGGLRVTWDQTGALCTVMISGTSPTLIDGYYTASHCSDVYAGPDGGTTYFQNQFSGNPFYLLGSEGDDPAAFSGGSCAAGRVCRNADILFITTGGSNVTTGGNTIFKTTGSPAAGADGSITIAGTFTVTSGPPAVVGDSLQKMGQTSGWTKGAIQSTCVDKFTGLMQGSQQIWILCNDVSSVWSKPGDSGSPMFRPSGSNVQMLGILWGGPSDNFNETWHSPCANIAQDLPFYQVFCS